MGGIPQADSTPDADSEYTAGVKRWTGAGAASCPDYPYHGGALHG